MENLLQNPWISGIIIFITQIFFVYFRTLNVIYNSERKLIPTILTGNVIGICWLITVAFGISAVIKLQWQPIVFHIIGGTLGVIYGFKTDKHLKKKKHGRSKKPI